MIHPIIIAICIADGIAVLLLFAAALQAEPIVRQWEPAAATRRQLSLERSVEAASLLARAGAVALAVSSVALIVAVAAVLPSIVPGAMCGTGVIEAADAEWALVLRGLALLMLRGWSVLDRLDRRAPRAPLARWTAAALLPAAPITAWTAWQTFSAWRRLDGQRAVDCCAAMYAEAASAPSSTAPTTAIGEPILFALGAAMIAVGGLWLARTSFRAGPTAGLAIFTAAWTPLAAVVLLEHFAAYHYEVLAHPCPWCLFLWTHGGVGYVVFGALAVSALESVSAITAIASRGAAPDLRPFAERRAQRAALGIAAAVVIFTVVATGPALHWWWRYGVWL